MREFSSRMRKNTGTLHRRAAAPASRTVSPDAWEPPVTLSCSAQPLGDTGRRQDRYDEHNRLGELSSWRFFVSQSTLDAAGLTDPWAAAGDVFEWKSRRYSLRGQPVSQTHDDDGSILSWSFDADGIA